jgi:hypothetical protein
MLQNMLPLLMKSSFWSKFWSNVGARFERQGEDGAGLRGHAELCRSHHSREDLHAAVPKTKGLKASLKNLS